MVKRKLIRILCVTGVLGMGGAASADYAFNDFAPGGGASGGTFDISDPALFAGSEFGAQVPAIGAFGYQFLATTGGRLTELNLGLQLLDGTNSIDIAFYSDNNDQLGSRMASWSNVQMPQANNYLVSNSELQFLPGPVTSVTNSDSSVVLSAGQSYWIVATTTVADTDPGWFLSVAGGGTIAYGNGLIVPVVGGIPPLYNSYFQGAFDVQVNPVPEPISLLPLGIGLCGVACRRKR